MPVATKTATNGQEGKPTKAKPEPVAPSQSASQPKDAKRVIRNFPLHTLQEAMDVPQKIQDEMGGKPFRRLLLAEALGLKPGSSNYRDILSSANKYGLIVGNEKSIEISLTEIGSAATHSLDANKRSNAIRLAAQAPEVFKRFYANFADRKLPSTEMFRRILAADYGIPEQFADACANMIVDNGRFASIVRDVGGSPHVLLDIEPSQNGGTEVMAAILEQEAPEESTAVVEERVPPPVQESTNNRVFITHGKNTDIVNQLKELLTFGSFVPVVAAENETVSKPVPDKVMDDMRSCYAAIIHVGKEIKMLDQEGKEHVFLNQNVLIEIGAAMALYTRRFILLVERGATLPSNLQGLYEVRYEGDKLDYEATMKLLRAFNDFKS
jgi:predicted nucleotide-binding protein